MNEKLLTEADLKVFEAESVHMARVDRERQKKLIADHRRMSRKLERINAIINHMLLVAPHDENCDAVTTGPDLGSSTKPCNCYLREIADVECQP